MINRNRFFLISISLSATAVLFTGCYSTKTSEVVEKAAKDWSAMIRGAQVIPIFPLEDDFQPGDVFLVERPVDKQQEEYSQKGYLSLENKIVRIQPKGYRDYYSNSFDFSTNLVLPRDWYTSGTNTNRIGGNAYFPTMTFSLRRGAGASIAVPVQGIPVGLNAMSGEAIDVTVDLGAAKTLALDMLPLYRQLEAWSLANTEFLKNYAGPAGSSKTNFLRVINKVYAITNIFVSLDTQQKRSLSASGGSTKPLTNILFEPGTNLSATTSADYTNLTTAAQKILTQLLTEGKNAQGTILPGGSLAMADARRGSVYLKQGFPDPLIVGYLAFDRVDSRQNVTGSGRH